MTDKELRTLDEMLTNLEIWSTWNKTFANEMIVICSKMRNLLANRKTEPTISKMEQVEDETRLTAKCLNCANGSSYNCSKCDGEMYFSKMYFKEEPQDEPQTSCKTCRYGEVDEGYVRCAYYSKATEQDEPQTDCAWK